MPATFVFDYPSISEMQSYIVGAMPQEASRQEAEAQHSSSTRGGEILMVKLRAICLLKEVWTTDQSIFAHDSGSARCINVSPSFFKIAHGILKGDLQRDYVCVQYRMNPFGKMVHCLAGHPVIESKAMRQIVLDAVKKIMGKVPPDDSPLMRSGLDSLGKLWGSSMKSFEVLNPTDAVKR